MFVPMDKREHERGNLGNTHDALCDLLTQVVEALERAMEVLEICDVPKSDAVDMARKALAKAKGQVKP